MKEGRKGEKGVRSKNKKCFAGRDYTGWGDILNEVMGKNRLVKNIPRFIH